MATMRDMTRLGAGAIELRVFIRGLRQKLEPDPTRPTHSLTEFGVGYRLQLPPEQRAPGDPRTTGMSACAFQCAISTGNGASTSTRWVKPPKTHSRRRLCPYPPITNSCALCAAAVSSGSTASRPPEP